MSILEYLSQEVEIYHGFYPKRRAPGIICPYSQLRLKLVSLTSEVTLIYETKWRIMTMIRHATFINSNTISVRAFSPGKFSGAVKRQPFTSLQFLRSLDGNFGTVIEPCQPATTARLSVFGKSHVNLQSLVSLHESYVKVMLIGRPKTSDCVILRPWYAIV
jgi:hypothetical protein